ncbi:MAG: DNA-binding protein WhiA, partial [Eubacteriales bacterium]|nr:DNA-binding protein WhiA [Eubacteriales bacterium]
MSFAVNIKMEIVRERPRGKEALSQLAALTHAAGSLRLGRVLGVEYVTETLEVGRQIATLATALYGVKATIAIRDVERRRGALTAVTLEGERCETLLQNAGLLMRTEEGVELRQEVPENLIDTPEARLAFLRGAYLGAGSCTNPKRGYHMEIVCRSDAFADALLSVMEENGCGAKRTRRKDKTVVYLKEGDKIAGFLALLGASSATLAFEDARVVRDMRNYINRTNN